MNVKFLPRRTTAVITMLALSAALVSAPLSAAAAPADPAGPSAAALTRADRGALLSVTPVAQMSVDDVKAALAEIPFDSPHIRYGVRAYRVEYRTIDTAGRPTIASGLVVFPDRGGHRSPGNRLPVVVYEHGTRADRNTVASMVGNNGDRETAVLFASAGYAAVAPDYLGLGTGTGNHPYMHAESAVTASIDLLDAAARLGDRQGLKLDSSVRVTGFSQGGPAAMALGRALQRGDDGRWRLAALAPISGPYDVQHAELPALLDPNSEADMNPVSGMFYVAYWTVSMNRLYHLYDSPSEVFRAPYDERVEQLFDGYHDEATMIANLPGTPTDLLTPEYIQRALNPTGALREALRDSDDTCQWRPRVPVRLYAARGDRDVVITNAEHCQQQLNAHGADVPLIDVGSVEHLESANRSIPRVLDWFEQLR
ncbi:lipase [Micromonospora musae]|uniref:alpha/beta hydrolase family protein n=1 Tax=Micromonospora musae TaxID=1894970 RepID=UPI003422EB5B